ncbi:MAG TPA: glucoamylase family protein [Saprospiraceae bacterium]|nr:glucoamylase family protein [Saprospiraceae bacterium]
MNRLSFPLLFACFFAITFGSINAQQLSFSCQGYDMHTELRWSTYPSANRYQVWNKKENDTDYSLITTTTTTSYIDWTGRTDELNHEYQYFLKALSIQGNVLTTSDTLVAIVHPMTDDEFLDMTQASTFRYFYDYAHPVSGMARERLGSEDIVTTGGSGFGVMAILAGIQRGYITREQGVNHLLKIVSFLQVADRFHGAFPHWMNGKTGEVIPFSTFDNGGDLVETAFLMEGLLCARAFFDQDNEKENVVRDVITALWEDVEWDWYSRNNSGVLYWHWSPNYAWQMNFPIHGWNEALMVYLLAIASPSHPVDASYYHTGWACCGYTNGNTWYGKKLFVGPHLGGPLFFAHYSFMGFDPRGKKDAYCNYFLQNQNHTYINRSWCMANPLHFEGYDENTWGLTASDDPWGYLAHAPLAPNDNGTITPAAGIPSMPYTPNESMALLKNLYRTYGQDLWGEYGFKDAFNPGENWFAASYLAIDQGPIINMIENFRSALLWNLFMSNAEIQPALDAIGFVPDSTVAVNEPGNTSISWSVYPTVNDGTFYITLPENKIHHPYEISIVNVFGRTIYTNKKFSLNNYLTLTSDHEGLLWVLLKEDGKVLGAKAVLVQ